MIYLKLFLSFLKVGALSIGGGYAAIPLIQNEVVNINNWISLNDFSNLVAIAEMTPGPIAVNAATFVGVEIAGIKGALVATLACIIPSLIIVSILAKIYFKYKDISFIKKILNSVRPVIVAVITSAGISILIGCLNIDISFNYLNLILCILAFIYLLKRKANPIFVMSVCGIISLVINTLF